MCNINILVRRRDANIDKEVAFMQTVTTLSYDSNNDADGVFFSDGLVMKSSDKLNLISLREHFVTSKMVMTHQRIATSGKEEQYHQPFTSEEFAFMHNGIVSSFATGGHSDTHNMFQTFLKYFNKNNAKNKSRQEKITKSIQGLCKKIGWCGSYSIAIFDRVEEVLYYFKDSSTRMSVYRNDDYIYFTTKDDNSTYLSMIGQDFVSIKVEENKIFIVRSSGDMDIYITEDTGAPKYQPVATTTTYYNRHRHLSKPIDDDDDYYGLQRDRNCTVCGLLTRNPISSDDCIYCNNCLYKGYPKIMSDGVTNTISEEEQDIQTWSSRKEEYLDHV